MIERRRGGCACPIRGARVNRLRSNATKRPIRGRELIEVRDLFKEIRYVPRDLTILYLEIVDSIHNNRSLIQV